MALCLRLAEAVCFLYVLYLLLVRPLLPYTVPGTVDLRVTNFTKNTNGVLHVSVVLTNSTPISLNVLDDSDGNPAFILEEVGGSGMWLTHMVNSLKINLAPGASLTNVVFLTNPPPQFRLMLHLRDLADEHRRWPLPVGRLIPEPWRTEFIQWNLKRRKHWAPASGWILPELARDMQPSQP
jgi:hypothetical protein